MTRIRIRKMPAILVFFVFALFITFVVHPAPEVVRAEGDVVPAIECTVPELSQSELVAIVSTASALTPVSEAKSPGSEPSDDAVMQAVSEVVRLSVACANANMPLRSLSLFSERYLQQRFGADSQDDIGHLIASISRTPGPVEDRDLLSLDSISEGTLLADGRLSVVVTTSNARVVFVDTILLFEVEGTWLIDEVILGTGEGTPSPIG